MGNNVLYSEIEREYEQCNHVRKTIEGRKVGCSKCVGYCNYDRHRGYLTSKDRDLHMCLNKSCNHYIPKTKEDEIQGMLDPDDFRAYFKTPQERIDMAKKATEDFEGMAVTGMSTDINGYYEFSYVTITDSYDISSVARILTEDFGTNVTFRKINCSFDHAVKVIFDMDVA